MHDDFAVPRIVEGGLIQPGSFGTVDLGVYPSAGSWPEVSVTYEPHGEFVTGSLLQEPQGDKVRLVYAVQNYGDVPCRARITLTPREPSDPVPPPA